MKTIFLKTMISVCALCFIPGSAAAENAECVSLDSTGVPGNGPSQRASVSDDGRFIAFDSEASNLVLNDGNNSGDVFIFDGETNEITRVSVNDAGEEGNGASGYPEITPDGRFVTYWSDASNLVENDNNGVRDVFVYDTETATTVRVSVDSMGVEGDGTSYVPTISDDGNIVAFQSAATNLVADDENNAVDIFVHDRASATTTRISLSSAGLEANDASYLPDVSSSGRYVAFESIADNLVDNDNNNARDVFMHDRDTSETNRLSVSSSNVEGDGLSRFAGIGADGRFVVFESFAGNLGAGTSTGSTKILLRDTQENTTVQVSLNNSGDPVFGSFPEISENGQFIIFEALSEILGENENNFTQDVYIFDTQSAETSMVSKGGNDQSHSGAVSADGRYVAFSSYASNLTTGDLNSTSDVFITDLQAITTPTPTPTPEASPTPDPAASPTPFPVPGSAAEAGELLNENLDAVKGIKPGQSAAIESLQAIVEAALNTPDLTSDQVALLQALEKALLKAESLAGRGTSKKIKKKLKKAKKDIKKKLKLAINGLSL